MTNKPTGRYLTAQRPLPNEVSALLSDMRARTGENDSAILNEYVRQLHQDHGWTLRVLANGMDGVVAGAIEQRIKRAETADPQVDISGLDLPFPDGVDPVKPIEDEEMAVQYQIPDETIERMKQLQEEASTTRGSTPEDAPSRKAGKELAHLMYLEHEKGVTYYALGNAIGVAPATVKMRLGRYGYVDLPPSAQHTLLREFQEEDAHEELGE